MQQKKEEARELIKNEGGAKGGRWLERGFCDDGLSRQKSRKGKHHKTSEKERGKGSLLEKKKWIPPIQTGIAVIRDQEGSGVKNGKGEPKRKSRNTAKDSRPFSR